MVATAAFRALAESSRRRRARATHETRALRAQGPHALRAAAAARPLRSRRRSPGPRARRRARRARELARRSNAAGICAPGQSHAVHGAGASPTRRSSDRSGRRSKAPDGARAVAGEDRVPWRKSAYRYVKIARFATATRAVASAPIERARRTSGRMRKAPPWPRRVRHGLARCPALPGAISAWQRADASHDERTARRGVRRSSPLAFCARGAKLPSSR